MTRVFPVTANAQSTRATTKGFFVRYLLAALSVRAGTQEDVLIQGSTTPRDLEFSGTPEAGARISATMT